MLVNNMPEIIKDQECVAYDVHCKNCVNHVPNPHPWVPLTDYCDEPDQTIQLP